MPLGRFTLLTAAGSAVWNALLIGLGWTLAENWRAVDPALGPVSAAVACAVVLVLGVLVFRKLRNTSTA